MTDQPKEMFRQRKTKQLAEMLGCDVAQLPAIFADPAVVHPLKKGVHADLTGRFPEADAKKLSHWLGQWVNHGAYLNAIRRGLERKDLDGAPAGAITVEEIRHAGGLLQRRKRLKPKAQPSDDRSAPCTSPEGHVMQTEVPAP